MYEERKNSFSLRDIILQLLLVVLFILVMIWLFPTKSYLEENYVTNADVSDQLQALYGRLFADNIESMRDAAKDYYTTSRLPKNVGDSVTLTLEQMIEKKLVISFKDSNNESCDLSKSYVQLTKMDDEYQMKVQLTCSDYSDYIIVYMGCYDYCDSDICEQKEVITNTNTTTEDKKPTQTVTKYQYEYAKTTNINGYTDWGTWSNWTTTSATADYLTQVEIDKRQELVGYNQVWGIVGYIDETYTDYEDSTSYKNVTTQVQVGTTKVQTGTKKVATGTKIVDTKAAKATTTSGSYSNEIYVGTITSTTALSSTSTVRYEYVSDSTTVDCSNVCKNVTTYVYKKYTRTYTAGKTTYSCSAYGSSYKLEGTKCNKYATTYETVAVYETVPVYKDVVTQVAQTTTTPVTKTRKVAQYGYVNGDPIYKTVTYYRYRTRSKTSDAETTYKWSSSKTDKDLLEQGYKLTGNVKKV